MGPSAGLVKNAMRSKYMTNGVDSAPMAETRRISLARSGDREAFEDLFRPHESDLRKFIASRVNSEDVDDVFQELSVSAWRGMPSFNGSSRFRTWIFGICIHKIKDHYRRLGRQPQPVSLVDGAVEPAVSAEIERAELSQSVWSLTNDLPDSQFEVIELYYRYELTLLEISETLNRNLNTVKYQFCQAHAKLMRAAKTGGWL